MTLRTRLTLLTFCLLLLSLLASLGLAGAVLWRVEISSITRQLTAQADALVAIAQEQPGRGPLPDNAEDLLETNGITGVARVYNGPELRWAGGANGPDVLDSVFLSDQEARRVSRTGDYLVLSRRAGDTAVQVGRNLRPLRATMRLYAGVASLTLLLLSLLGGALTAREVRRTLRPLEDLAAGVRQLDSPHSLDNLPALQEQDEVGQLARALQHSLHELRAERERETLFLANASHELRTPVTALLADLQHTLSRERTPQELLATLRRTEATAGRLRQLTGNLMTLTRAQRSLAGDGTGQAQASIQATIAETDLLELAGEAVDLLQPLALQRGSDLWLDGRPAPLQADPALLSSVLENLIGNAIKFTPPGGEIRVEVQPLINGGASLCVQDSGPGFPAGALTQAFVRGQPQSGARAHAEGFGLGLAVVSEVVAGYGGTLELSRSTLGGAEVRVTLPGKM